MANKIVSAKDFRAAFRTEIMAICDFSNRKSKHILGIGPRQVRIDSGVTVLDALVERYSKEEKALEKSLMEVYTPKGARSWVSSQLGSMAAVSHKQGANIIETLWMTLGDLVVVARRGRQNVYVAKAGATRVELLAFCDLRTGKLNASMVNNERITDDIKKGAEIIGERSLADLYAETVTESFKAIKSKFV